MPAPRYYSLTPVPTGTFYPVQRGFARLEKTKLAARRIVSVGFGKIMYNTFFW